MPKKKCKCRGRSGVLKKHYRSWNAAKNAAMAQGMFLGLRAYRCPTNNRIWHLTER